MSKKRCYELILARVYALELLKDFYQRAVKERNTKAAAAALQRRKNLMRVMRNRRGYEQ